MSHLIKIITLVGLALGLASHGHLCAEPLPDPVKGLLAMHLNRVIASDGPQPEEKDIHGRIWMFKSAIINNSKTKALGREVQRRLTLSLENIQAGFKEPVNLGGYESEVLAFIEQWVPDWSEKFESKYRPGKSEKINLSSVAATSSQTAPGQGLPEERKQGERVGQESASSTLSGLASSSGFNAPRVAALAQQSGFVYLKHFTPCENLEKILTQDGLLPASTTGISYFGGNRTTVFFAMVTEGGGYSINRHNGEGLCHLYFSLEVLDELPQYFITNCWNGGVFSPKNSVRYGDIPGLLRFFDSDGLNLLDHELVVEGPVSLKRLVKVLIPDEALKLAVLLKEKSVPFDFYTPQAAAPANDKPPE